ncbi:hypothetical protein BK816_01875 [Boudabousia tangfeifanii]|uniref:Uncharacterized protein n=1 Tax=Boudabousia tangfeifanii TaxID=1912795 RepID=A0A1D9MIT6_9ACTO|nr:hypothetical protein [Boudabousia tangfeifanii]AOZ72196.1 hypothetical protein BK816_01875 [Boudabousia tangfeifanii]
MSTPSADGALPASTPSSSTASKHRLTTLWFVLGHVLFALLLGMLAGSSSRVFHAPLWLQFTLAAIAAVIWLLPLIGWALASSRPQAWQLWESSKPWQASSGTDQDFLAELTSLVSAAGLAEPQLRRLPKNFALPYPLVAYYQGHLVVFLPQGFTRDHSPQMLRYFAALIVERLLWKYTPVLSSIARSIWSWNRPTLPASLPELMPRYRGWFSGRDLHPASATSFRAQFDLAAKRIGELPPEVANLPRAPFSSQSYAAALSALSVFPLVHVPTRNEMLDSQLRGRRR